MFIQQVLSPFMFSANLLNLVNLSDAFFFRMQNDLHFPKKTQKKLECDFKFYVLF